MERRDDSIWGLIKSTKPSDLAALGWTPAEIGGLQALQEAQREIEPEEIDFSDPKTAESIEDDFGSFEIVGERVTIITDGPMGEIAEILADYEQEIGHPINEHTSHAIISEFVWRTLLEDFPIEAVGLVLFKKGVKTKVVFKDLEVMMETEGSRRKKIGDFIQAPVLQVTAYSNKLERVATKEKAWVVAGSLRRLVSEELAEAKEMIEDMLPDVESDLGIELNAQSTLDQIQDSLLILSQLLDFSFGLPISNARVIVEILRDKGINITLEKHVVQVTKGADHINMVGVRNCPVFNVTAPEEEGGVLKSRLLPWMRRAG